MTKRPKKPQTSHLVKSSGVILGQFKKKAAKKIGRNLGQKKILPKYGKKDLFVKRRVVLPMRLLLLFRMNHFEHGRIRFSQQKLEMDAFLQ